jgi:hypothetical protein
LSTRDVIKNEKCHVALKKCRRVLSIDINLTNIKIKSETPAVFRNCKNILK